MGGLMRGPQESFWSVEDDATLRALTDQGFPASHIGKVLGRSRNAVLGRRHRLGLVGSSIIKSVDGKRVRRKPKAPASIISERPKGTPSLLPVPKAEALPIIEKTPVVEVVPEPVEARGPVTIDGLAFMSCRWPLWAHKQKPTAESLYCGETRAVRGRSLLTYCAKHSAMAFTPVEKRAKQPDKPHLIRSRAS